MGIRDTDIEYRRADLPATDEQAFANEKVKALVKQGNRMREALEGLYGPNWEMAWFGDDLAAMEEKP